MRAAYRFSGTCVLGLLSIFIGAQSAFAQPTTQPTTLSTTQPAGRAVPEPLATQAELQQLFDEGNAQELLRQLPRVFNLRGKVAEPYNMYDLQLLRFDLYMRQKAQAPALTALAAAHKLTDDK